MEDFNWTCPHCGRDVTISRSRSSTDTHTLSTDNVLGPVIFYSNFIVCPNQACRQISLSCNLWTYGPDTTGLYGPRKKLQQWNLIPQASVKVFPSDVKVPTAVYSDYKEACLIKDLSPKASATLSRRCLQGILRDFWKVKPGKLVNEIKEIESKVDHLSWEAIDAVRKIGNIGAHMESDIDVIVEVDAGEADQLISLIEILIQNWYVETHMKQERLKKITAIAAQKQAERHKP